MSLFVMLVATDDHCLDPLIYESSQYNDILISSYFTHVLAGVFLRSEVSSCELSCYLEVRFIKEGKNKCLILYLLVFKVTNLFLSII